MRIVVTGLIGQYPFGGVIWDYIQYVTGFRKLGHEVYYLEDTGVWPYDPIKETITEDCTYQVESLSRIMKDFGMDQRWIYRNAADGVFHGAGEEVARDLMKYGDLLVNVSTASWFEDYEVGIAHQMFIDGDPLFTQVRMAMDPEGSYTKRLRAHDSHFSFGLNLHGKDCRVPDTGIHWKPTLQPVDLDFWRYSEDQDNGAYTTVMNWVSYKPVEWEGKAYGQKDIEFLRFVDLPQLSGKRFSVAMGQGIGKKRPTEMLIEKGWTILEPDEHLADHHAYHRFLSRSHAEWSIAKQGYVEGWTGWFSCRTACYLAAGRPALVQDTGWTAHLPHGQGLLSFIDESECKAGLNSIDGDYERHRRAARCFAEEDLDSEKVCRKLLESA